MRVLGVRVDEGEQAVAGIVVEKAHCAEGAHVLGLGAGGIVRVRNAGGDLLELVLGCGELGLGEELLGVGDVGVGVVVMGGSLGLGHKRTTQGEHHHRTPPEGWAGQDVHQEIKVAGRSYGRVVESCVLIHVGVFT